MPSTKSCFIHENSLGHKHRRGSSYTKGSLLCSEPQSTFVYLSLIMQKKNGLWGTTGIPSWATRKLRCRRRAMQCIKFESWRLDPRCWGLLLSGLSILRCVCPSVWVCLICLYRRKTDASAWMPDTCASFGWKILLIIERTPMRIPYMKFWEHRTFANVTSLFHYRPKTFHEECLWLSSVSPNNWSWVALLFPLMSMRAARSDDRCGILWACFPDLSDWLLERLKPLHS